MNPIAKLAGFGAVLGVLLAGGWAVGALAGPVDTTPASKHSMHDASMLPGGLAVAQDGYALALDHSMLAAGSRAISFRIDGPDGQPVTSYEVEHGKRLHLIVVRRDYTGFQHVHPVLDGGTWTSPALALTPGAWRVFADFTPGGGPALTLGADLFVPGQALAATVAPTSRADSVDGYDVTIGGELHAGAESPLTLTIRRDGAPVDDLLPYLGAYGHLVALREGDLAYLHVHPLDGPAGPTLSFAAEVPSAGRYHLYLGFRHHGAVHTAQFVVEAHS